MTHDEQTSDERDYGVELIGTIPRAATDISPKVTFAALGAAVATVAVWAFETALGIDAPTAVELAVGVILTFGAGYIVPDNR